MESLDRGEMPFASAGLLDYDNVFSKLDDISMHSIEEYVHLTNPDDALLDAFFVKEIDAPTERRRAAMSRLKFKKRRICVRPIHG
jgi:hypothetical protein